MNRIRLAVIAGFALAFAAGGSVGMLVTSEARRTPGSERTRRRHLARELNLTPEQQEQMRKIWSEVMRSDPMQQLWQRRSALRRERTEALEALLTDQQRQKYDQILADYARQRDEIDKERRQLFQQAVERTKAILSEEQAKKYDEMRKNRRRGRGPGSQPGGFRGGWWNGPRTRPARVGDDPALDAKGDRN